MRVINNQVNNMSHMTSESATLSLRTADHVNTKLLVNVTSANNTSSTINRQGNFFQGLPNTAPATGPGTYRDREAAANQQRKDPKRTHNPLNKQGNSFQRMPNTAPATGPGTYRDREAAANQQKQAPKRMHNPLNSLGNTFKSLGVTASGTRPGMIKNINSVAIQKSHVAESRPVTGITPMTITFIDDKPSA